MNEDRPVTLRLEARREWVSDASIGCYIGTARSHALRRVQDGAEHQHSLAAGIQDAVHQHSIPATIRDHHSSAASMSGTHYSTAAGR